MRRAHYLQHGQCFDGEAIHATSDLDRETFAGVLIGLHWLDEPSILRDRATLQTHGYLADIRFNTVIDTTLALRNLSRSDIYVTQAFDLIPATRSEQISPAAVMRSFDEVTRFEFQGRQAVALGEVATG